jgi:hypothetical protein
VSASRCLGLARIAGLAAALVAGHAQADAPCGLCARAVVTNSSLAKCFLDRYEALARQDDVALAIDLSDCESDRGIVASLPSANAADTPPDTEFLVTHSQLACLKRKLEMPGLVLDPSARIGLDDCL